MMKQCNISGIDTAKGIAYTGGEEEFYYKILATFKSDAEKRLALLKSVPDRDSMITFITQVHSLKSASATIGADQVSKQAAELEAAGRAEDLALIGKKLPVFTENLKTLIGAIQAWENSSGGQPKTVYSAKTVALLTELAAALEVQNCEVIDSILERLKETFKGQQADSKAIEILEKIEDDVLLAEFDRALENVRQMLH